MGNWTPRNFDEVCRRATGRRRYLAQRREVQGKRQRGVLAALMQRGWHTDDWRSYGTGRTLAEKFNVSEATISRDVQRLENMREMLGERAPAYFDFMLSQHSESEQENVIKRQIQEREKPQDPEPEPPAGAVAEADLPKDFTVIESANPEQPLAMFATNDPAKPYRVIRFHRPRPKVKSESEGGDDRHWLVKYTETLHS